MAFTFQVPRQKPVTPQYTEPMGKSRFDVPRQGALTQGARLAEQQNTQGLKTGQFGDVESARVATERANALRTSNALQATRGTFARSGVDTSPEAAARAQDQSFSAAEGQNLNGTNAVNQLQRQYRNDAVTNANQYEAAANQRQQQGVSADQFNKTFGANREDANTAKEQFGLNYSAGREDANTAKNQFGETMAQRKNEFGVSSGQSQQQIDNQSKQFIQSQAQRDKEFGVTAGQSQQQINNQVDQFGKNLNQNQSQFDKTYSAGREDAATAKSQFDITRGDKNAQFDITASQSQQQIDNQAKQAAEKMGYDYASLSQADKQFFQSQAQNQGQFDITASQSQQQIDNQAAQAAQRLGYDYANLSQNDQQFFQKMAQDQSQFDVSSDQTQQEINNRKSQFDITRGDTQKSNTMNEINAIQDPVARNLALKAYYSGGDVSSAIGGNIGADGQLINKSMSPGAAAYQAKVDELQATYPNKSQAEIQQMVQERAAKADTLTQGVTDTQTKAVSQQTSMERLSRLKAGETPALEDLANIPSVNPAAIPLGKNTAEFLKNNTTGGWTNIGGQPYKVIKGERWKTKESSKYLGMGESARHEDFAELQDPSGKTLYLNAKGQIVDKKPGTK